MAFAIFKGEKTIADLVSRLFQIKGPASTADAKQAAAALVAANPHLVDLGNVPVGSTIVVPDTPSPVNPAELIPSAPVASAIVEAQFTSSLAALKSAIPTAVRATVATANTRIALAQTPEVQAAAAQDPVLAQRLAAITAAAKADLENAQTQQDDLLQAIAQVEQALVDFNQP